MFPGAALMYLVGANLIHTLRRELTETLGSRFDLRAFHPGQLDSRGDVIGSGGILEIESGEAVPSIIHPRASLLIFLARARLVSPS